MRHSRKLLLPILIVIVLAASALIAFGMNESVTNLKFSHNYHHDEVGLACDKCHDATREVKPGIHALPQHAQCVECHEFAGKENCDFCHINGKKGGGFGKPTSHITPDWTKNLHGIEATARKTECWVCHNQSSCDACHNSTGVTGKPHPAGYRFNHATDAAFGGRCLTCHETREYCTSCHRASIPMRHPLGSAWANLQGGAHRDEAQKFIETCLACHDVGKSEPTCARCHNK